MSRAMLNQLTVYSANYTNEHCLTKNMTLNKTKLTRMTCITGDTVICEALAIFYNFYTDNICTDEHKPSDQNTVLYKLSGTQAERKSVKHDLSLLEYFGHRIPRYKNVVKFPGKSIRQL